MAGIVDPFDSGADQPASLRQQQRALALKATQSEMAARGVSMARAGQEMGVTAQMTPVELELKKAQLAKALQDQATKSQYKLTAGDNELVKKLADQYAMSQVLAPRSAEFMKYQGYGDKAVPTGPIYSNIPHSPVPNLAVNISPDRDALGNMNAINQATWALTKPAGAGQIRQFEAGDWKTAFPNTANLGNVNAGINDRNQREAADLAAKYNLITQYIQKGKSPAQALADYANGKAAKGSKVAAPNVKYLGIYTPPSGGGGSRIDAGGDPAGPDNPLDDSEE